MLRKYGNVLEEINSMFYSHILYSYTYFQIKIIKTERAAYTNRRT